MARINLLRSIGEAMVCFAVGIIRTILVTAVARGPVLRRRFFSKAVPIGFLVGFLTAPAIVLAAGTWQWTAQITGNGMPVLGPFATNEQAVQALGAAIVQRCTAVGLSCPLEATTLVDQGVITMTPTTQTFEYGAVTPSTPGPWSCYFWSDNPTGSNFELILGPTGCYTSEASAVAAQTSMPGCYTQPNGLGGITAYSNYWPTAEGNWSQLFAQSTGGFVEGSSKLYNVYQQNPLLQNNCATTFGYSELLWRARAATCPAGFEPRLNNIGLTTESGSDTPCYGILGGTVTGNNLLDCPANAGPSTLIGDPCNVATGDFTQTEPDYSAAGLNFTRAYHSLTPESRIGVGWTHNYARYLVLT